MASTEQFDVIVATDCRLPAGSAASTVDEIRAQYRAGYRTGLLHVPTPTLTGSRSFAPALRELVDEGSATLVTSLDEVTAKLLLVRYPPAFTQPPVEQPKITADLAMVVANVGPDGPRRYERTYEPHQVSEQVERIAGVAPSWAPISPVVRDALAPYVTGQRVMPWDWEPVIDIAQWQVERAGFVSDRPVLGRHTADHWTKWPGRRRDLLAAYPDDSRYDVRILGGIDSAASVAGYRPGNWSVVPFGDVPPQRFLATIDFFVYLHHRRYTEPFGRAILEAVATGAVAIVPEYLEPIFGDACRYCRASDVQRTVDELYADWDAFAVQSRAGVERAAKRFGTETHLERLSSLIGEPEATTGVVAPPVRPRGTLVVDLTRDESHDSLVSSVVRATVAAGGPRIVVLPAARASGLSARVAVETFPRAIDQLPPAGRRQAVKRRIADLLRDHDPARLFVVDDGHGGARDLLAELGDDTTERWIVQSGGDSEPPHDAIAEEVASILPPGWAIISVPAGQQRFGAPRVSAPATDLLARAHRRLSRWLHSLIVAVRRRMLRWLQADARASGLMLVELADAQTPLPVPASGERDADQLPVALVVVADQYSDPAEGFNALVERQLVSDTFRAAVLVPPHWEPAAAAVGLTVETYVQESTWTSMYGAGWSTYLRRRVEAACQAVAASIVVFADRIDQDGGSVALDVLEAARVRPPARPD